MRKIFLSSLAVIAILSLTGCGNTKKLNCNQSITTAGLKQNVDMNAEYAGDEIVYYGLRYDMDLSKYSDSQITQINNQDMCSMIKTRIATYSNAFTNCKQKIENKHLIITADFDLDVLKGMTTEKRTIEDLKTELEKQNYTCTIK